LTRSWLTTSPATKQRHTAKRIFERLRAEYEYTGGYTIVKDYVRQSRIGGQEMFVPLSHAPGEAQADFGEAVVVIAGVEYRPIYGLRPAALRRLLRTGLSG